MLHRDWLVSGCLEEKRAVGTGGKKRRCDGGEARDATRNRLPAFKSRAIATHDGHPLRFPRLSVEGK